MIENLNYTIDTGVNPKQIVELQERDTAPPYLEGDGYADNEEINYDTGTEL